MTFFELSLLSLLFFLSSLSPGSVCSLFGCDFSESSLFCFCSDPSSYFLRDFLRPPGSSVLRRSCSLFLLEVFLSAFEIFFSGRPFFFLGVEVWPGPSVFSPALGSVDSSLGSGKIRFSVFVWAVSCCSDPGTFCWCCGTLSLPCRYLWSISLWALGRGFLFCLFFLRLRFPFYGLF